MPHVYTLEAVCDGQRRVYTSKAGDSPKEFLEDLLEDHRDAKEAVSAANRTPPRNAEEIAPYIKAIDRAAQPPLKGAKISDLLRQAREFGDAAAIAPSGRLRLEGLDLSGHDVSGADFSSCEMPGAELHLTTAHGAKFENCNLRGIEALGIRARNASFARSDMRRCVIQAGDVAAGFASNSQRDFIEAKQKPDLVGAGFEEANLSEATVSDGYLANTRWKRAKLIRASFQENDFTEASFERTDAREAVFLKNTLRVPLPLTDHHLDVRGGKLAFNSYFDVPGPGDLLVKALAPVRTATALSRHIEAAIETHNNVCPEMAADIRGNIELAAIGLAAGSVAAMAFAGPLAATGAAALFATYNGKTLAAKAAELFFFRFGVALTAFEAADGPMASLRAAGAAFFSKGAQAKAMAESLRQRPDLAPRHLNFDLSGGFIALDSEERIRNLLVHMARCVPQGEAAAFLGPNGSLQKAVIIRREVGGAWPEESAPVKVKLWEDGGCTAAWNDAGGQHVMSVHYNAEGNPTKMKDAHGRVFQLPAEVPVDPFFLRRRAAAEELKDAVCRSVVAYDARTHRAHLANDGSIVIRSAATGRVDNPDGAAIRKADGTEVRAVNGSPVRALPAGADLKLH